MYVEGKSRVLPKLIYDVGSHWRSRYLQQRETTETRPMILINIASLYNMGTSLGGNSLLPGGANYFL